MNRETPAETPGHRDHVDDSHGQLLLVAHLRAHTSPPMPSRTPDSLSRPLNVTDALTYLDAVKVQFQDKPDVYNNFLDIMKDFKSEVCVHPPFLCPTNTPTASTRQASSSESPCSSTGTPLSSRVSTRSSPPATASKSHRTQETQTSSR